jgi:hypothetical protein
MVIMMNPGSSKPLYPIINSAETKAIPDPTQLQIIKVMNNCNFNYARILNLSDIREPKSKIFFKLMNGFNNVNIPHSIFSKTYKKEFKRLFIKNVPVIVAWGVNEKLSRLAKLALKTIDEKTLVGLKKPGSPYGYYHPLPPNQFKQKAWVNAITEQLQNII